MVRQRRKSRLLPSIQKRLLEQFAAGVSARTAAELVGIAILKNWENKSLLPKGLLLLLLGLPSNTEQIPPHDKKTLRSPEQADQHELFGCTLLLARLTRFELQPAPKFLIKAVQIAGSVSKLEFWLHCPIT